MKNKNTLILVLILVLLSAAYYFFVVKKGKSTLDPDEVGFAVKDTSAIEVIHMIRKTSGKKQAEVLLERQDSAWQLNGKYPVLQAKMDIFLKTLKQIRVKEPVLDQAKKNMLDLLARENTEVEIRMKNGDVHKYYVGTNTQDNQGTFMLLQGADNMYVTFLPGHTGYLNSRYSTLEDDWRDNILFVSSPDMLEYVSVQYAGADSSFVLERKSKNAPWMLNGAPASLYAEAYVGAFSKTNAESRAEKYYPEIRKELSARKPDVIFEVKNFQEKAQKFSIWYRSDRKDLYFALSDTPGAEFVSLQEFHFGKYLKKHSDLK